VKHISAGADMESFLAQDGRLQQLSINLAEQDSNITKTDVWKLRREYFIVNRGFQYSVFTRGT
jgi:hypothetical protein